MAKEKRMTSGIASLVFSALSMALYYSIFGIPGSMPRATGLLVPFYLIVSVGCVIGVIAAIPGIVRRERLGPRILGLLLNAALLISTWVWQPMWGD